MYLTTSGLSDKETSKYIYGQCSEFAIALYDELTQRGLKDINFAILTTNNDDYNWVHICVQHKGNIFIDAEGWGNGNHIIDNEVYYDAFTPAELEEEEDVILKTVPYKDLHKLSIKHNVISEETKLAAASVANKYCK